METNLRNSFWNPLCPRDDTTQLGSDDGRLRPHKFLISGRHLPTSHSAEPCQHFLSALTSACVGFIAV